MTREDRMKEQTALRRTKPERLIALYRAATNTPPCSQLPRGLGFTGMIDAILLHEIATGKLQAELQQATA